MPRNSYSEPTFDRRRQRWKVEIPATLSSSGKRSRSFFPSREKARAYIAALGSEESPAATITPTLAIEAAKARSIVDGTGFSLVEAARIVKEATEILRGTGGKIEVACRIFAENYAKSVQSVSFIEGVHSYLSNRVDLRPSTISSYRYTLETAFEKLHPLRLSEITPDQLQTLLSGKGRTSMTMHLRNLGAFWRWACSPPRRWAHLETFQSLERPRGTNDSDISVLRANEVRALLESAQIEGAAAAFAIAVFAGIRMAEIERLTWRDVRQNEIEISKAVAKKHARRLVPISPTLSLWLEISRRGKLPDELIVPANWTDVSKSVRRRAGWKVSARLLKNPPEPTRGPWPANVLRHTCASVLVALGTPLEKLIFQFGHSGGHELLRRHYVSRMTEAEALEISQLAPQPPPTE
jgi:integrase